MPRRLAVLALAFAPLAFAQQHVVPRTSWGEPSLEGTYTNKDEYGTPLERPDDLAGRNRNEFGPEQLAELMKARSAQGRAIAGRIGGSADNDTGAGPPHWYEYLDAQNGRPWFVSEPADGKVPAMTDEGKARAQRNRQALAKSESPDTYTQLGLYQRCITIGLPGSMMPMIYGNAYSITQAPGVVAIQYEMVHEARVIPTDGSKHVAPALALRYEDPATWTAPWAIEMPLKRGADAAPFEYACHEGNLGLHNILSAARATDRAAQQKRGGR
jgi:hypothetical protein